MRLFLRDRASALAELRSPRELLLLIELAGFAATVPALMRLPLPHVDRLVSRKVCRRQPRPGEIARLDRLVSLAPRVGRPLVRGGCLTRGLTLFLFLRRIGVDVRLRFGIDPGIPEVAPTDGHCWLTLDGQPFLEPANPQRFTELYCLPLAAG